MENIKIITRHPETPNSVNRFFDINLYDCPECKHKGMKLKSCRPLAEEINAKRGLWLPEWEYEQCGLCEGTGKVEDLTPEYAMD